MKQFATLLILTLFSFTLSAQETELIYNDSTYIYHSVDEAMKNPERVFRLNMSKHKLDTFPNEILQFHNLTELDLSRNRIAEIPPGIGQLTHLQILNMGNNKLVNLPAELGTLKELRILKLNRNEIVALPSTIGGLQSLEILELWDNELDDIPDEIAELQNLKMLELRGILFSEEQQARIDSLVIRSAKVHMSPACNCKN